MSGDPGGQVGERRGMRAGEAEGHRQPGVRADELVDPAHELALAEGAYTVRSGRLPSRTVSTGSIQPHGRARRGKTGPMRELESFYRRYNQRCNDHRFDLLGDYVAEGVEVNGEVQGLRAYVAGLRAVVRAFPDYRWNLRHLLVDGPWIAAHFLDTGTHRGTFLEIPATGRTITIQEFATYRVDAGRIVEVWVTADNLDLLTQLR
jgi:predicted ester cyclase